MRDLEQLPKVRFSLERNCAFVPQSTFEPQVATAQPCFCSSHLLHPSILRCRSLAIALPLLKPLARNPVALTPLIADDQLYVRLTGKPGIANDGLALEALCPLC